MRFWKNAAIAVTCLGLLGALLVFLARVIGFRIDGIGVVYSLPVQELAGISVLLLLGAVLYLVDRVVALGDSMKLATAANRAQTEGVNIMETDREAETAAPVPTASRAVPQESSSDGIIRIEQLTKVYELGPVQVHALRDASLDILPGSVTVILGPSGSGKTTLLNLLGGIDRATSGHIRFDGVDVTGLDESHLVAYRRDKVGFVFQFFNLIPSLTARENVALAAELVPNAAQSHRVLRLVGLGERMDHFPAELSGGEQQRVAIARALVKNPPLLLCDEPTGELDYATGVKILEILKDIAHRDGRAVVVVTHNGIIAEMADQVVRLRGGRIDEVVRNPEPVPPSMLRW